MPRLKRRPSSLPWLKRSSPGCAITFLLRQEPLSAKRSPDAMISVVSMVRRGSVVVSFLCGAVLFRERNLRSKAVDLAFILVGMFFLWLGSRPA